MSRSFESPPAGLSYDTFSGSVCNGMLYRLKSIEGLSKVSLSIVPTSGQNSVSNGNKIIVSLPMNSLIDLSTLEFLFTGQTNHAGADSGGATNYVQTRFFPRNMQSLISNVEVKINGKSIQNITQYNYIYNVLHDYMTGHDATTKKRIGENADPSAKSYWYNGVNIPRKGYPIGYTGNDASQRDKDNYVIRNWLGLFSGSASTNIIHTDMYGQIDLEITLDQAGVLMLGTRPSAATAYVADTYTPSNFQNLGDIATAGSVVAAEAAGFTLSNISFNITRIDMPASFYEAMRNVLASGAVYKLYYPNYSVFTGQSTTDKSGTTRFSITTRSLDYCIGTFQVANRDTIGTVINSYSSNTASGEYGQSLTTVTSQIAQNAPRTFNQSKYFVRNGSGVKQGTWIVGNVRLNPETPLQMYNSVLRGFGMKNDLLGGIYPGIKNFSDFIEYGFGHMLSLQAVGESDMYTISGLDSSQQPVSIAWEVLGGDTIADGSTGIAGLKAGQKITNDGKVYQSGDSATPIIIAAYSSHLDITVGRNISLYT